MPLPIKSPANIKSARSFFRKTSRETSRNVLNLTRGLRSRIASRNASVQQESYLDAVTSRDSQKNVVLLQEANKTAEEINLLQQSENKILEDILNQFEHASKVKPKDDDKDDGILKDINSLFDYLRERVNRIRDASRNRSRAQPRTRGGRVAAAARSIAGGVATGMVAEGSLSYLTGKDETLSALGLGLSPLATGALSAVAGIKGLFELSDKLTPESRKGADIRPQDIEKAFGGQLNVQFDEDVEPFKSGQIVSVGDILKAWELDKLSKEEQEATIKSLLDTKKAKPVKDESNPNLRRISTAQRGTGSIDIDKIIFDADSIRFLTDNLSFGAAPVGQSMRPGFQRISAPGAAFQPRSTYSDITPGADVETTDAFKSTGPDSLGQEQKPPATRTATPSISGLGDLQRDVSVSEMGSAERVIDFFTNKGYTREQAAGIAANIQHESAFKTDAVGDNGKAYGLAQWHPDRQEKFKAVFGKDIRQASFEEQLEYINWELNGPEKAARNQIITASTAADAAMKFDRFYERSSGTTTIQRMQLAEKYVANEGAKSTTGNALNAASVNSEIADITLQRTTPRVVIPPRQSPGNVQVSPISARDNVEDPSASMRLRQNFKTSSWG